MTESRVFWACATRVHGVYTFLVALFLSVVAVQAGAWEEFEARCLVPMENFEPIETSGMTEIDGWAPEEGTRFLGIEKPQGTYFVIITEQEEESFGCGLVSSVATAPTVADAWDRWRAQALRDERYVVSEEDGWLALPQLESTFREPRLQVAMIEGKTEAGEAQPMIFVLETDLEA